MKDHRIKVVNIDHFRVDKDRRDCLYLIEEAYGDDTAPDIGNNFMQRRGETGYLSSIVDIVLGMV